MIALTIIIIVIIVLGRLVCEL